MSRVWIACAALLLAGCATASREAPASRTAPAGAAVADAEDFGNLTPRKLDKGACGLFLWTRSSDRRLVFFSTPSGSAVVKLKGREESLTRTAVEGDEVLGVYERQSYTHGAERLQVSVAFEHRPGMSRGVVVPQGSLRLTRPDGWEMILPVGGLVACEQ